MADDHECSDDGDNIARCMVCDECAQARARVDGYDDEGNFMPMSDFHQESKRAARRERDAARYAKIKADPVKYKKHLAAQSERDAARHAKIKADPEKLEKHKAAKSEYDAARYAKIKEDPEKLEKHKAAQSERDAARHAKIKADPEKLEKHKAAKSEYDAARYAKIKEDPEKLEKHKAAKSEYNAARRAKLKKDPEKLKKRKATDAARRVKVKKIKLAKLVISSLDDNIGALYNAASVNSAAHWIGLSHGPINKALEGDGLLSLRDGTELYRIREAAPHENLAVGMTEAGEMNWHYSVDVPATWSSDCTDEDVMGALALLFT
eukprot:scaffold5691_cov81-Skeletonema_dohrnii-CCMP3373.AAC.5